MQYENEKQRKKQENMQKENEMKNQYWIKISMKVCTKRNFYRMRAKTKTVHYEVKNGLVERKYIH